jgi:hypothetical protein
MWVSCQFSLWGLGDSSFCVHFELIFLTTLRTLALHFNVYTPPNPMAFEPVQTPAHTLVLNLTLFP